MTKIFPLLILGCLLLLCNPLEANQSIRSLGDTTTMFEEIKFNERQFKLRKQRHLKRIETSDRLIIFACETHQANITSVMVINRHLEKTYYWFIDNTLFKITLETLPKTLNGNKLRRGKGICFIQNDMVFYKEEKGIAKDVNALIGEANKYLSQGLKILLE